MIIPGMSGMGKTPPRKCPAGQQLYAPGTKSERCVKVATILPPKPKPAPKPAPIVTADFLSTLPLLAPAATPAAAAAGPASQKIFGLPRTLAVLGGGALALGLVGYLVLRRK